MPGRPKTAAIQPRKHRVLRPVQNGPQPGRHKKSAPDDIGRTSFSHTACGRDQLTFGRNEYSFE